MKLFGTWNDRVCVLFAHQLQFLKLFLNVKNLLTCHKLCCTGIVCLASRRNLTNAFLLCDDIKVTEPQTVDVMDCTLTHVPARCPRAIRVIGICAGRVMCERHSYLVSDQSHYVLSFFISVVKLSLHQVNYFYYPLCLLCHQSAFTRLLTVVKGTAVGIRTQFFIDVRLAYWTHSFALLEPECTFFYRLRDNWILFSEQWFSVPLHLTYADDPLTA